MNEMAKPSLEADYILPDDYVEETEEVEEVEEVEEETETEEETTETEEEEATEEETEEEETEEVTEETENKDIEEVEPLEELEIKYLKESKKLKDIPKEELKVLVQKGFNHDRISEKLEHTNAELEDFKEIAELYGYDITKMKEQLFEQYYNAKAEADGVTPEVVKREHNLQRKEKGTTEQQRINNEYNKFIGQYPDVKIEQLTQDTLDRFKNGMDLISAYQLQQTETQLNEVKAELEKLKQAKKVEENNAKITQKAVVKKTTNNGNSENKSDDFLEGLLGG